MFGLLLRGKVKGDLLRLLRLLFVAQGVITLFGTLAVSWWAGRFWPCPPGEDCSTIREFVQMLVLCGGGLLFVDSLFELWFIRDNDL